MPITPEDKRNAIDLALASKTFSRAHSLRAFLRHICELELAGQGSDLTEHRIGVEALGRQKDYSTGEDSTVRSQAYALRKKLDDLYRNEYPGAEVRISLVKGSYRPQFTKDRIALGNAANGVHEVPVKSGYWGFAGGLCAGVLMSALVAFFLFASWVGPSTRVSTNMKKAWGPVLSKNAGVLLCIGTPVNLWVRDLGETLPSYPHNLLEMPSWPGVSKYYEQVSASGSAKKLYLQPHQNTVPFGEAAAASVVARTLSQAGVSFEITPESKVSLSATHTKDIVLFGKPEFSPAARGLLKLGLLNIAVSNQTGEYAIVERLANGAQSITATPRRDETHSKWEEYGLITVIRRHFAGSERRTIVFSGIGSGSVWGAAEFFCSTGGLQKLESSFRKEGLADWPASYQVLVRVSTNGGLPSASEYVTHRILTGIEPLWPGGNSAQITDDPASGDSGRRPSGVLTVANR